jgi:dTDP-4-amino-4,6-dideoxygalactose transaminase
MEAIEVPFFDFRLVPVEVKLKWQQDFLAVVNSGSFIGGSALTDFEKDFASHIAAKYSVGVGNGYDALVLALKSLGIGEGDKVLVPAHTFIATWLAVRSTGAIPIGVDCDDQGLINLDSVEALAALPSAIIPVHMHGLMVDMPRLMRWAQNNKVLVVEDCAQAHGASIAGKYAGTWGDVGAFSFYPTKNLGALGDGGIVVTNNLGIARNVRQLGSYGANLENRYKYEQVGINSRLDPLQAKLLSTNLGYLDSWNARRIEISSAYEMATQESSLTMLQDSTGNVRHHFCVIAPDRDFAIRKFRELGVQTHFHYGTTAADEYSRITGDVSPRYPIAEKIARHSLSLPLSPWMNERQVNHVVNAIRCIAK